MQDKIPTLLQHRNRKRGAFGEDASIQHQRKPSKHLWSPDQVGLTAVKKQPSMSSPLSYVGAKGILYEQVMAILPAGTNELVSPFCGGASLEIRMAASGMQVYAYDKFDPVPEFFRIFNGRSAEVAEAVRAHPYPMFKTGVMFLTRGGWWWEVECPVTRAAYTWMIFKQSFYGRGFSSTPVAPEHCVSISYFDRLEWKDWHNPFIEFAVGDWEDTLEKHPNSCLFLDPPYVSKEGLYGLGDQGEFGHEALRDALAVYDGEFIMTYGDHPDIHDLYDGFRILRPKWTYGYGKAASDKDASEELLIISDGIDTTKWERLDEDSSE